MNIVVISNILYYPLQIDLYCNSSIGSPLKELLGIQGLIMTYKLFTKE